jgi:nucleotide-binding universal stress UspA family protein
MTDVVLAVLGHPETACAVLDAAARLRSLKPDSRLQVLAVLDRLSLHALQAEVLISEAETLLALRHEIEERGGLRAAFERWTDGAGEAGAGAQWFQVEETATAALGERGSRADVIIAAQPAEYDRVSRQLFRAALFGTDRPVLMVPRNAKVTSFGRTVAIAWRDQKQAARAVIPALRYLTGASDFHVLMGLRDPEEKPAIPRIFLEHGISVELHSLPIKPGPFGARLLAKAHELGDDLMVMGAYAHSPLRELVLGGVTKYMLDNADLPILMRH